MTDRTRSYWKDAFEAFFIQGNFGLYADAYDAFLVTYPEFREFVDDASKAAVKNDMIRSAKKRFTEADRSEHESPMPTPPHLRDAFLPYHVDVPPMSQSVNAFDGQGRVSMLDATPQQHRRHHRELKRYHHHGQVYHAATEEKWVGFMDQIQETVPILTQPVPMKDIPAMLEKAHGTADEKPHHDDDAPPVFSA